MAGYFDNQGATAQKATWANPQVVPESQRKSGGWYFNPQTGNVDRWWGDGSAGGGDLTTQAGDMMADQLANQLIDLDAKLSNLVVYLSDAEKDAYLKKAQEQIQPYYDKERARIEAGIKENKIRTAEDLLMEMRTVQENTDNKLAELDITKANTEEEFVNTLASMTAQKGEDLEVSRLNWMGKVDSARKEMAQSGFSNDMGGIGTQEYGRTKQLRDINLSSIERKAGEKQTSLETNQKYDLERIALARKAAEQARIRSIGTASEAASTKTALTSQAGLPEDQLISEVEMARRRAERDVAPIQYGAQKLTDLESEQKKALEARNLELQAQEKATREQAALSESARQKAELVKKYKSATGTSNYLQ